ncbi:hypothetical protein ACFFQF_24165 [Haladaptatus pallidirubidus]|uniref:N-acetyltransferase domain-containing protein n=1 Tax=Haladaptatus pallidirubidus TaxID=1008152 RepID=A0AAV3UIX5_9EURY|nr:hypothetical protein [Haladaptatus pallidirubidus]
MRIREAASSDSEAIRNVHFDSITELGLDGYTPEQVHAWAQGCKSADYSTAIESNKSYSVVAEEDFDAVGFGSVSFDAPEEYEARVDAESCCVLSFST